MSELEVRTSISGTAEVQGALKGVGDAAKKAGQEAAAGAKDAQEALKNQSKEVDRSGGAFKAFREDVKGLALALAGTAAVASIFARGNPELQRSLEATSLAIAAVSTSLRALGAVMRLVASSPIVAIIGGLIALGAAIYLIITNWERVKQVTVDIWTGLVGFLRGVWEGLATAATGFGNIITGAFSFDLDQVKAGWEQAKAGFAQTGSVIASAAVKTYDVVKEAGKTAFDFLTRADERRRLEAKGLMEYQIAIGTKTLHAKIALLEREAFIERNNKEKLYAIRLEQAGAAKALADAEMKYILENTELTKEEQVRALGELAGAYFQQGAKMAGALRAVGEAMAKVAKDIKTNTQVVTQELNKMLEQTRLATSTFIVGMLRDAQDANRSFFRDIIAEHESLSDAIRNLWERIRQSILNRVADIIADYVWGKLLDVFKRIVTGQEEVEKSSWSMGDTFGKVMSSMGGAATTVWNLIKGAFSGISGGLGGLFSGFGGAGKGTPGTTVFGGFAGAELAAAAPGISSVFSGAVLETGYTAAAHTAAGISVAEFAAMEAAGGSLAAEAALEMAAAEGAGFSSILASMGPWGWAVLAAMVLSGGVGNIVSGITDLFGGIVDTVGSVIGDVGDAIGDVFSSIGDIFGFAHGGDFMAASPQLIRVGENGPEYVSVRPAGAGGGGGGVNVNVSGPLILDDLSMARFVQTLMEAMRREGYRYA
mgnify:CR=1 FL=1